MVLGAERVLELSAEAVAALAVRPVLPELLARRRLGALPVAAARVALRDRLCAGVCGGSRVRRADLKRYPRLRTTRSGVRQRCPEARSPATTITTITRSPLCRAAARLSVLLVLRERHTQLESCSGRGRQRPLIQPSAWRTSRIEEQRVPLGFLCIKCFLFNAFN